MQNRFIDLYSDTKTKPSPGMRKAMADAEVGDEQKMEDPTVNRLRERVCELLGKEDAVFLPSGTMANQIAIRVHCRLGDEVIADRTAHIINAETGGTAANSGVMIRMLDGPNGVFTGEQVKAALRDPNSRNAPRSRLVSVENTSNGGFGTVWPLATLQGVAKVAREAGVAMHMDGARLCNAAGASPASRPATMPPASIRCGSTTPRAWARRSARRSRAPRTSSRKPGGRSRCWAARCASPA